MRQLCARIGAIEKHYAPTMREPNFRSLPIAPTQHPREPALPPPGYARHDWQRTKSRFAHSRRIVFSDGTYACAWLAHSTSFKKHGLRSLTPARVYTPAVLYKKVLL